MSAGKASPEDTQALLKSQLVEAGKRVCEHLSSERTQFKVTHSIKASATKFAELLSQNLPDLDFDLGIDITNLRPLPSDPEHAKVVLGLCDYRPGCFYFDIADLSSEYTSPEFLELVLSKCFNRADDGEMILSPFYAKGKQNLYRECEKTSPWAIGVPINLELIELCMKYFRAKQLGVKYAIIGRTSFESLEQRIENFIVSGRADRVVSAGGSIGPCVEDTILKLLKDNGTGIKTKLVMRESFPKDKPPQHVPRAERWRRVVVD